MDAVIYARSAQPNRKAHEEQREVCRRFADEHGYEVIEEFHDIGRTRPGLDQLLATIRDGKASAVIVTDAFRLGRTLAAFTQVIEALDDASVRLYVVGEGRVDLPTTRVLGIMCGIAEFDATRDYEAEQKQAEADDFAD
jgi:DNA invertase Pin-like site-specific DNA recombinase